jgi:hypothetical protein
LDNFLAKAPSSYMSSLLNKIFFDKYLSKETKYISSKNSFCNVFIGQFDALAFILLNLNE